MHSLNAIRSIVAGSNSILATATHDLPADWVNQPQPGHTNTVAAIYAHAVLTLDHLYHTAIQNQAQVLIAGGFVPRLGAPDLAQASWERLNTLQWDWAALRSYGEAVVHSVDGYLSTLTDEELGRACRFFDQEATVQDAIGVATWHTALHAGEIAALRGVSGMKGLPF